jgi:predicted permease
MITLFDLKNTLARLAKDKRYSLTILFSMSLGLGVFLFLFSQVYVRNYSTLPFTGGELIVYGSRFENDLARLDGALSDYDIHSLMKKQNVLDDMVAVERRKLTLSTTSFTEQVTGAATSSNMFKIADVPPILGRVFQASDDVQGAPPVLIIGYGIWERLFQKQNDLIGKVINVDGIPTAIVGVMPQGFRFPRSHDVWLSNMSLDLPGPNVNGWSSIIGKLKQGVSLEQADDAVKQIAKEIATEYPQEYSGKSMALQHYTKAFVQPTALLVSIMSIVAFSVLLMSLFSVVSLIIVKMIENTKEAAIKNALGIPFFRVIAGPLLESFILCALAGFLGLFLCYLGQKVAGSYVSSPSDAFWWEMKIGMHVILAAFLFSLVAWFFTGILPIYLALRKPSLSQLAGGRKGGGGNKAGPIMNSFVSLQVSCVFLLMVFTGICLYSLYKIANADYGVKTDGYTTAWVQPAASIYPELKNRIDYFQKLEQQMMQLPDVEKIAFAGALPGTDSYSSSYNSLETNLSNNGIYPEVNEIPISENFFDTFNTPLLKGRTFVAADDEAGELVVIISEDIERKISPGGSAVGKKIQLNPEKNGPLLTIVGVAPNLLYGPPISMYGDNLGALYRPMKQVMPSWYGMRLAIKLKSSLQSAEEKLLSAGRNVDPQVALTKLQTYNDFLTQNGNNFRSLAFNFTPATLLAFLMSALGIYAISARTAQQKINDIGVMKALGISDAQINKRFMLNALIKLAIGLVLGAVLFLTFMPNIISKLVVIDYKVLAVDSIVVSLVLTAVVLIASYIPLLKAHKLTPQEAINRS